MSEPTPIELKVSSGRARKTGECPIFIPRAKTFALAIVDIDESEVCTTHPILGGGHIVKTGGRPGFIQATSDPNLLIAGMEFEIGSLNLISGRFDPIVTLPLSGNLRINEGRRHPTFDYFLVGVMDLDHASGSRKGSLWIVFLDGRDPVKVLDGLGIPNGIVFHDGLCYWMESREAKMWVFPANETGVETDKRTVLEPLSALFCRDVAGRQNCYGDGMFLATNKAGEPIMLVAMQGIGEVWGYNLATGLVQYKWKCPGSSSATCVAVREDGLMVVTSQGLGRIGTPGEENAGLNFYIETNLVPAAVGVHQLS